MAAGRPDHAAVRGRHEVRAARASRTRSSAAPASSRSPGLLAPTSSGGQVVTSVFPALDDPEVAVDVLRGDLGLDDGRGQSIFTVDRSRLDTGELTRVARENMRPGDEITLDDGTRVRFDGVRDWVSLQVSHDPAQVWVLVSAVFVLAGLMLSLAVRRRRFWVRLTPRRPRAAPAWSSAGSPARTARATARSSTGSRRRCWTLTCTRRRTAGERRGARHLQRPAVHGGGRGLRARDGAARRRVRHRCAQRGAPADAAVAAVGVGAHHVAPPLRRRVPLAGSPRRPTTGRRAAGPTGSAGRRSTSSCSAALLQLGSIVCRGLATDRWPLGNMYEFTSAVCLAAVVTWLVVLRRVPALRAVALFVLLPVVVLLFLAGTVLYARAAPVRAGAAVVLAGRARHHDHRVVGAAARPGSGEPAVPGCAGPAGGGALVERLPSAAALDRLAYRTTIVAFPALHLRRDRRRDLGGGRVGPVLGLGPQGDRRVRRLGRLRRLPARPRDRGLAQRPGRVDQRRRASRWCCSTCSSSTWWSPACTPTPASEAACTSLAVRDPAPRPASRPSGTTRLPSDSVVGAWYAGGPVVTQR